MEMRNWLPAKEESRRKELVHSASLFVLLAVLAFVAVPYAEKLLVRTALYLVDPLWKAKDEALEPSPGFGTFFTDKARLIKERDALKRELTMLKAITLERDQLKRDMFLLRGIKESYPDANPIVVPVIAYPSQSLYDTLIIDLRGVPDTEYRLRDFVYASGVVVGTLTSHEGNTGKVTLL